jgi:DNA replication ATP-dependent helicase Dna2
VFYISKTTTGPCECLQVRHCGPTFTDKPGDIINVISPHLETAEPCPPLVFGFANPTSHIILHPDNLLTMTSIANALPCSRKPLVQALIKTPAPPTKPLLYGNLIHTLLQGALQDRDFSAKATSARLEQELKKETIKMDIWWAGLGIEEVREEVGAKAREEFQTFAERWVGEKPNVSLDAGRF